MKYVEVDRIVEPHSECILFAYFRDANGVAVPNLRMKIWAGPPPTGEPPYFRDDDPYNPNRRTDSNGKFQFIVANPAPDNPLDFYVQALGPDEVPQSDPVHFPFPPHEARWLSVTMAPKGTPAEAGDGGAPVPTLQLDPRLQAEVGVTVRPAQFTAGQAYWKLISGQYQNPDESGGNVNIVCFVQGENGLPLPGVRVIQQFPGDQASGLTDERGHVDLPMTGDSSFSPERGEHGPYIARVDGAPSDAVIGMGLPLRRHVQYVLTWRRVAAGEGQFPPNPPAASVVQGHIVNAPAGAQATLLGDGAALNTPLGVDGTYLFNNLTAGTYSLTLSGLGTIKSGIVVNGTDTVIFDYQVRPKLQPTQKVFGHYLLFGSGSQPGTLTNLIIALDYIIRFAPLVGFSPDEARSAQRVTIVGDTDAVTSVVEQSLRDAGCLVARLAAPDSYALEGIFKHLIDSGSPHPTG